MVDWFAVRGPRLVLRPFIEHDADQLLEVQRYNRVAFESVMPVRTDQHFTIEAQQRQIARDREQWQHDGGYAFAVVFAGRLVGRVTLTNVVRGAWQNATLGYWIDGRFQGRGLATEAVLAVLAAAFQPLELHRVQAAIMPRNTPSLAVIQKVGLRYEGYAPRYLNINGVWEDHRIYSLTREDYQPHRTIAIVSGQKADGHPTNS